MSRFESLQEGVARVLEDTPRMPAPMHSNRAIEGEYVTIRFSTVLVDDVEVVTRLLIEAKHPKVLGDTRVFDLSHILVDGYQRHPRTVKQIIDPELSLDSRLDALSTVAVTLAGVNEPVPPVCEVEYGSQQCHSVDGLEPSFSIKNVVLTEFSDILRGFSRRAVTVVRNAEPFVQFHINETNEVLCDASIVILPTGLELPLLDRDGQPVSESTLNAAIHDLTYLLQRSRYAPPPKLLETLAVELMDRLARNPNPPRSLSGRNFCHEVVLAAQDDILWGQQATEERSRRGGLPAQTGFKARQLPDGRTLWIRHRQRGMISEVAFVGDSLEGARFELTFHYPVQAHQRVARVLSKTIQGDRWPCFEALTDLLHSVRRSGFGVVLPETVDTYPSAVNALMREVAQSFPESCVERGLLREDFNRLDFHLPNFVSEFVMGRSPFCVVIDRGDPSASWYVQAFLDRDLKGGVYAVNALGGSVVACDQGSVGSLEFRQAQLLKFFKLLAEDSDALSHNASQSTEFHEVRRNLPERSPRDAMGYSAAIHGVSLVWEALLKEGGFSPDRRATEVRWHTHKVKDGVWSVSLVAPSSRAHWLPYLITVTASVYGVAEISYSRGGRGPFGGLLGRRVSLTGGRPFTDEEVSTVIRTVAQSYQGILGMSERRALTNISPSIRVSLLSSLREVDPEREQRDLFKRLWNFIRNIW